MTVTETQDAAVMLEAGGRVRREIKATLAPVLAVGNKRFVYFQI